MTSTAATRCARCESPLEHGDLRCPICAQAVPQSGERRERVEVDVLRCEGCGAAVEYDVKAQAPRCPFCGATTHVETIEDPMEKAGGYLPFTVDADDLSRVHGIDERISVDNVVQGIRAYALMMSIL